MDEKKYTRNGEKAVLYECKNCEWEGTEDELMKSKEDEYIYDCPKCGYHEFYGFRK